jgi:hypothetical protein
MTKLRFPNLRRWAVGFYFPWSMLVYFGSLGGDGHDWWPIFLFPLIFPLSLFHLFLEQVIMHSLVPSPTQSTYILEDRLYGAFYIIGGTAWIWFISGALSRAIERFISPTSNGGQDE